MARRKAAAGRPETPKPRRTAGGLPGLGVRTLPSGREVYTLTVHVDGLRRRISLGPVALLSSDSVRRRAARLLLGGIVGEDPVAAHAQKAGLPRFDAFAQSYWRACAPAWKPATRLTHAIYLNRRLLPTLGALRLDALDGPTLARWFGDTSAEAPGAANRALDLLTHMLRKAQDWGVLPPGPHPCAGLRRNPRRRCRRFLSGAELRRLGRALSELEGRWPVRAAVVRLLLLTGCRRGEILGLHWSWIRGGAIHLPDAKAGPRVVPLGPAAVALIRAQPRQRGRGEVFLEGGRPLTISALQHFWNQTRTVAALPGVRLHDLRHTFASHAVMGGETLPTVSRLLGHARQEMTLRYAHVDDEHLIEAAERVGATLALLAGTGSQAKINPSRLQ